jgi:hypothetical protein
MHPYFRAVSVSYLPVLSPFFPILLGVLFYAFFSHCKSLSCLLYREMRAQLTRGVLFFFFFFQLKDGNPPVKAGSGKKLKALVFFCFFSKFLLILLVSLSSEDVFSCFWGRSLFQTSVVDSLTKSHHLIVPLPCWEMNTLFTCSWEEDRIDLRLAH